MVQDAIANGFSTSQDPRRKTVLLIRWILIVVVGYLTVFSSPGRPLLSLPNFFIGFYILSNLLLIVSPQRWFEKDLFIFALLLFDSLMAFLAIYISAKLDSEFYVLFFLILFIASVTQKAKFLFFSAGLLLISYAMYSYIKTPHFFMEPVFLLRFSFIFVVSFFFNLMLKSYNQIRQEKDLLKEDYRELEILAELAQSIGQNQRLKDYLVRLNQTLCQKLQIERCTSILVDKKGQEARICFSEDDPEDDLLLIDLQKIPSFKDSLDKDLEEATRDSLAGPKAVPRYILKQIPLFYNNESLGTLYLRVNTPNRQLTHREIFFLNRLAKITALAIHNLGPSSIIQ